ncbi:MAG: hypothetical protein GY861_12825 [bacterium]|nr:hypothetical protein [bacterium]
MIINEFTEQCTELCHAIGVELPNNMTLKQYFNVFSYLSIDRFKEVVSHLKEYSQYKRFPLIFDFKKSADATYTKKDGYTPMKRENDNSDRNADWQRLQAGFKIMDTIRQMVCEPILGAKWNDSAHITCDIMGKFYREKVVRGMIFDVGNKKWISASQKQSVGGYYWKPWEWGNW